MKHHHRQIQEINSILKPAKTAHTPKRNVTFKGGSSYASDSFLHYSSTALSQVSNYKMLAEGKGDVVHVALKGLHGGRLEQLGLWEHEARPLQGS